MKLPRDNEHNITHTLYQYTWSGMVILNHHSAITQAILTTTQVVLTTTHKRVNAGNAIPNALWLQ